MLSEKPLKIQEVTLSFVVFSLNSSITIDPDCVMVKIQDIVEKNRLKSS